MKHIFFTLILLLGLNAATYAQQMVVKRSSFKIDNNIVVLDSTGKQLPVAVWQPMILGGGYGLRRVNPQDSTSAYTVVKQNMKVMRGVWDNMRPAESQFFTTGTKFDFFKDKAIDGFKVDAKTLEGKIVVLNFWFIGCPPCRMEIPELNKLAELYKDDADVVFIAPALDDSYSIKKFTKETPFDFHLVADARYWTNQYGINLFPTHVIIDKKGMVRFHTSGSGGNVSYWLRKTLDQLKAE